VAVPERWRTGRGGLRVGDAAFVTAARQVGVPVHVWTVNDPARMRALLALGVEGLVSDDLPGLRAVLEASGVWR
jgi:glycerophosphoryl diester phosphodiesterase